MLSEGRSYINRAPWLTIFPGLAIFITVFGINLLGDGCGMFSIRNCGDRDKSNSRLLRGEILWLRSETALAGAISKRERAHWRWARWRRPIFRAKLAASRDRVTIFHSSVADSIHPYNHSSRPIYGNWQHVIEPLSSSITIRRLRRRARRVVAVQGNKWTFKLPQGCQVSQRRAAYFEGRGVLDRKNAR